MADTQQFNAAQLGTLTPEEYAQQQQINRNQQMAAMLMQQNQQPTGQMISGRYVPPSWTQQLQPAINMLTGAYLSKQGDTEAAKLAQKIREGKLSAEESIINKMEGTPAQATELAGPYTGKVPMPVAVQPGTAPDLSAALREIRTNPYGAGKEYVPTILEQLHPKLANEEKLYNRAVSEGYKGNLMQFMDEQNRSRANNTIINMGQRGFDNTVKLGENFKSEPIYKAHQEVSQAYKQVNNALDRNDAAGDLAAAIKINKMFDPTGVVRETEAARIAASRGTLDTMLQLTAKVTKGEELTPTQRKQYKSLVKDFYDISGEQYNETRNKYAQLGKDNQLSGVETMLGPQWKPPVSAVPTMTKNMQDANAILGIPSVGGGK